MLIRTSSNSLHSRLELALSLQLLYKYFGMTPVGWLKARAVELGAACCTAAVLIGGLAIGVPFLRARIPEVFLYAFCCISAVIVRAALDLLARGVVFAAHQVPSRHIVIPVISRYPAGVLR